MINLQSFEYTKAYKLGERIHKFLIRSFFPTAILHNIFFCAMHPEYKYFSGDIYETGDYIRNQRIERIVLYSKGIARVYENVFWNDAAQFVPVYQFDYPEIFCAEIADVCVYGGTKLITANHAILEPVFNDATLKRWVYFDHNLVIQSKTRGVVRFLKSNCKIEKAISLCGSMGGNYYHIMAEVFPKLAMLEKRGLYRDYPILVDEVIRRIPALRDALELVNLSKHPIIYTEDAHAYQVNKLIYVSEATIVPPNLQWGEQTQPVDAVLSSPAIKCVRDMIRKAVKKNKDKKIYLARYKASNPRLTNDKEVADLCEKAGFKIVFPEEMSFVEQVATFMGARYVMGCVGAALTNTLFCGEGTKVFAIVPREHTSKLWSTFMYNVNVELVMIEAKIRYKGACGAKDVFDVDLDLIRQVLNTGCLYQKHADSKDALTVINQSQRDIIYADSNEMHYVQR